MTGHACGRVGTVAVVIAKTVRACATNMTVGLLVCLLCAVLGVLLMVTACGGTVSARPPIQVPAQHGYTPQTVIVPNANGGASGEAG